VLANSFSGIHKSKIIFSVEHQGGGGGGIEEITSKEGHTFYPHLDIKGNSGEDGIHFYSHLDSRGVLGLGKNTVFVNSLRGKG
jgi:hypothetical protein